MIVHLEKSNMAEEQLQNNTKVREYARDFINETAPIVDSSEINEDFYRIKAIEEGGLPVEIVGVVPNISYAPQFATNDDRNYVRSARGKEHESVSEEIFEGYNDTVVFYFGTKVMFDFDIYYKTAFDQVYKGTFAQRRSLTWRKKSKFHDSTEEVLRQIVTEVNCSPDIESVDDLSSLTTIDARLHPNENLTDGQIEIGDAKSSFKSCQKVERTGRSSNADALIRFVLQDGEQRYSASSEFGWVWSYISDVRGDSESGQVVITVETPIGKAVIPYNLNHYTESPFWKLVEESGGSLTSLRGKDICIRLRGRFSKIFKNKDIRNCGFNSHEYPEFSQRMSSQPITVPSRNDRPLLIDDPTEVSPVGVDTEYIWTIGVPPNNRFCNEVHESKSTMEDGLLSKFASIF